MGTLLGSLLDEVAPAALEIAAQRLDFETNAAVGVQFLATLAKWWEQRGVMAAEPPKPSKSLNASGEKLIEIISARAGAAKCVLDSRIHLAILDAVEARCISSVGAEPSSRVSKHSAPSIQPLRASLVSLLAELSSSDSDPGISNRQISSALLACYGLLLQISVPLSAPLQMCVKRLGGGSLNGLQSSLLAWISCSVCDLRAQL